MVCPAMLVLVIVWFPCFAVAVTVQYTLTATWNTTFAPDGFNRPVITVNGQFPAPTLKLTQGEILEATIVNHLQTEGLTVNWHGLKQMNSTYNDGVENVNQCAITAGQSFTYRVLMDRAGTFIYHAHSNLLSADGLYGALIVKPNSAAVDESVVTQNADLQYDDEIVMLISDWYHVTSLNLSLQLRDSAATLIEPQSLLLNGHGFYCNRTAAADGDTTDPTFPYCSSYYFKEPSNNPVQYPSFTVQANKRYRLRLINFSTLSYLTFTVAQHKLLLFEADGFAVDAVEVDRVELGSGQRYSAILTTDQQAADYMIQIDTRFRSHTISPAQATLHYDNVDSTANDPVAVSSNDIQVNWNETSLLFMTNNNTGNVTNSVQSPTDSLQLYNEQITHSNGVTQTVLHTIHRVHDVESADIEYTLPSTPLYQLAIFGSLTRSIKSTSNLLDFPSDSIVRVVVQNRASSKGVCEIQSLQLHGMSATLLASGPGQYNAETDDESINQLNPPQRDTFVLLPAPLSTDNSNSGFDPNQECGWIMIQFKADNVGVWMLNSQPMMRVMGDFVLFNIEPNDSEKNEKIVEFNSQSLIDYSRLPASSRGYPLPPVDYPVCGDWSVLAEHFSAETAECGYSFQCLVQSSAGILSFVFNIFQALLIVVITITAWTTRRRLNKFHSFRKSQFRLEANEVEMSSQSTSQQSSSISQFHTNSSPSWNNDRTQSSEQQNPPLSPHRSISIHPQAILRRSLIKR